MEAGGGASSRLGKGILAVATTDPMAVPQQLVLGASPSPSVVGILCASSLLFLTQVPVPCPPPHMLLSLSWAECLHQDLQWLEGQIELGQGVT